MYAIVRAGGHQEKVSVGDEIEVNRISQEPGATVELPAVMVVDDGAVKTGDDAAGVTVAAEIVPARQIDMGQGPGKSITTRLTGGVVGVILDGRGRQPFDLPEKREDRVEKLQEWSRAMDSYPERFFSMVGR